LGATSWLGTTTLSFAFVRGVILRKQCYVDLGPGIYIAHVNAHIILSLEASSPKALCLNPEIKEMGQILFGKCF